MKLWRCANRFSQSISRLQNSKTLMKLNIQNIAKPQHRPSTKSPVSASQLPVPRDVQRPPKCRKTNIDILVLNISWVLFGRENRDGLSQMKCFLLMVVSLIDRSGWWLVLPSAAWVLSQFSTPSRMSDTLPQKDLKDLKRLLPLGPQPTLSGLDVGGSVSVFVLGDRRWRRRVGSSLGDASFPFLGHTEAAHFLFRPPSTTRRSSFLRLRPDQLLRSAFQRLLAPPSQT